MSVASKKLSNKEKISWLITILCTVAILIGFRNSTIFNAQQVQFFAITVFYILITAFGLLSNMIIALMLPFTYFAFNLAPASNVFSSWSNNVVWMTLGGMLASNILARVGLLRRLVYWCVLKIGCSYRRIVFAFGIAGIIVNIISTAGGYLVFAAVAFSFIETLNLKNTKTGTGLMLAAALILGNGFVYSPSGNGLLQTCANVVDPTLVYDYVIWFKHTWPTMIVYFLSYAMIPILFKQDAKIDEDVVRQEASQMGKMSLDEKKSLVITLLFILLILTPNIHGIALVNCFILYAVVFFLPGINVGTNEDVKSVNYSLLFFISSFISIGTVASALKFNEVISQLMVPLLSNGSDTAIYASIYIFAFAVNFLMTPLAAISSLATPLTQVVVDLGIGVYPALYCFAAGLNELILPYEIAKFLVFYAYGMFTFKDFAKVFGIRAIMMFLCIVVIMIPYWRFLGLT